LANTGIDTGLLMLLAFASLALGGLAVRFTRVRTV